MKKRMNNKGQFYLLAAVLIAVALSGIITITTYSSTNIKQKTIENMGNELKYESARIVDYGLYNGHDVMQMLENFTEKSYGPYFLKKTQNTSVIFVYGTRTNLYASQYKQEYSGTISANIGGSTSWDTSQTYLNKTTITPISTDIVSVEILGQSYNFTLRDNQMFYFVIIQEKDGERYVEKN